MISERCCWGAKNKSIRGYEWCGVEKMYSPVRGDGIDAKLQSVGDYAGFGVCICECRGDTYASTVGSRGILRSPSSISFPSVNSDWGDRVLERKAS